MTDCEDTQPITDVPRWGYLFLIPPNGGGLLAGTIFHVSKFRYKDIDDCKAAASVWKRIRGREELIALFQYDDENKVHNCF